MFRNGSVAKWGRKTAGGAVKTFAHLTVVAALASLAACEVGSSNDSEPLSVGPGPVVESIQATSGGVIVPTKFVIKGSKLSTKPTDDPTSDACTDLVVNSRSATQLEVTCVPMNFDVDFTVYNDDGDSRLSYEMPLPRVKFMTNQGQIVVELAADNEHVQTTVGNFLVYVKEHVYDNTLFHRVLTGSVVQGGSVTSSGTLIDASKIHDPIELETEAGLSNVEGTIAMAQIPGDPNSATSGFFFNTTDNSAGYDRAAETLGYAVFGHVVEGMSILKSISTTPVNGTNRPLSDIIVTSVVRADVLH